MKKTLIALAALAAAGGAFAQSSVTISGLLDAGWQTSTTANAVTTRGVGSGNATLNNIKIAGTEDMGGGVKANFSLDILPRLADGTTINGMFGNGAWLGVQGGWGELRLGRMGTNTIGVVCNMDGQIGGCTSGFSGGGFLFNGSTNVGGPGTSGNAWFAAAPTNGSAYGTASPAYLASSTTTNNNATPNSTPSSVADATHYKNAARYSVPSSILYDGISWNFTTAYGTQPPADPSSNRGNSFGTDAAFKRGAWSVAGAWQKGYANATNGNTGDLKTVTANYDFGPVFGPVGVIVGGGFQRETATGDTINFNSAKAWGLTFMLPVYSWTPYAKMGNRSVSLVAGNTITVARMFNLGVQYSLSKRTRLYADAAINSAPGADIGGTTYPKQTNFGILHSF